MQRTPYLSHKEQHTSFSGIGSTIMRKKDIVVSNKKLFSNSGGLGPVQAGSEDWMRAKEKHERMQIFLSSHVSPNANEMIAHSASKISILKGNPGFHQQHNN